MIYQNNDFENQEMKIQCEFGDAIRELQISKLLKQANIRGKSQCGQLFVNLRTE